MDAQPQEGGKKPFGVSLPSFRQDKQIESRILDTIKSPFAILYVIMQVVSLILFAAMTEHEKSEVVLQGDLPPPPPLADEFIGVELAPAVEPIRNLPPEGAAQTFFFDIALLVFLGIGLSTAFLRKYGYSAIGFSLLTACISVQWGFLLSQFFEDAHCSNLKASIPASRDCTRPVLLEDWDSSFRLMQERQACACKRYDAFLSNRTLISAEPNEAIDILRILGKRTFSSRIPLNLDLFVDGMFAATAVLISLGSFLGKVSPVQLLTIGFLEVVGFGINRYLCLRRIGAVDDTGGSMTIHLYGCYFGLAVSAIASPKKAANNPDNSSRYNSDVLALVGSSLLWLTFPSFNAYLAPLAARNAVMVNTVLALISGAVTGYVVSSLLGNGKFSVFDVLHSTVAGGVAVSSVANLMMVPWVSMAVGVIGSLMSALGYRIVQPWLERRGITDTAGTHNLHGLPGVVAAVSGILATSPLKEGAKLPFGMDYAQIFPNHVGNGDTSSWQAAALGITVAFALGWGAVAGVIAKLIRGPTIAETFTDHVYWKVPADFKATLHEDAGEGFIVEASADNNTQLRRVNNNIAAA